MNKLAVRWSIVTGILALTGSLFAEAPMGPWTQLPNQDRWEYSLGAGLDDGVVLLSGNGFYFKTRTDLASPGRLVAISQNFGWGAFPLMVSYGQGVLVFAGERRQPANARNPSTVRTFEKLPYLGGGLFGGAALVGEPLPPDIVDEPALSNYSGSATVAENYLYVTHRTVVVRARLDDGEPHDWRRLPDLPPVPISPPPIAYATAGAVFVRVGTDIVRGVIGADGLIPSWTGVASLANPEQTFFAAAGTLYRAGLCGGDFSYTDATVLGPWTTQPGTSALMCDEGPNRAHLLTAITGDTLLYWRQYSFGPGAGMTAQLGGAPGAPLSPNASVSGRSALVRWSAPRTGAVDGYIVEAGSRPGTTDLARVGIPASQLEVVGHELADGVYYVRLRAVRGGILSGASPEVSFQIGGGPSCLTPPGATTGLQIDRLGNGLVRLSWNAASGPVASYRIEVGSSSGASNLLQLDTGNALTTLTGAAPPGLYFVRVRAVNACGAGLASNEFVIVLP
jgi:hypothetical protein